MLSTPKIEHHPEKYYAAIRTHVAMKDIPTLLPPMIPEVFAWLAKHDVPCGGAPFFQYLSYDRHTDLLLVAVGVPVLSAIKGDDRVTGGSFPEGDYAVVKHTGDFIHLNKAHMTLEEWAKKNGYNAGYHMENGQEFGSRTEFYPTDPQKEPNHDKWETDIEFLVTKESVKK